MRARTSLLVATVLAGAGLVAVRASDVPSQSTTPPARTAADTSFGAHILRLSEPGGYFDTDNLISNERSYMHVAPALRERAGGDAYVGVGPGQNFGYIALLRPDVAYIVDIRRDNLLEHLLFKALFERAGNRLEYLAALTGRALPYAVGVAADAAADAGGAAWTDRPLANIVAYLDTAAAPEAIFDAVHADVRARILRYGYPLDTGDIATIERFHREFQRHGLSLRFTSHGRAPMPYYPTLRELLLATDRAGRVAGAFADDASFQFLKQMQHDGRIMPVVGDFAGSHALRAIADELERDQRDVRAFYTSNVEYYLFQDGTFPRFADNLAALPWADDAVIVRAVFRSASGVVTQHRMPGYGSAQLAQPVATLLEQMRGRGYVGGYLELIEDGPLPPR